MNTRPQSAVGTNWLRRSCTAFAGSIRRCQSDILLYSTAVLICMGITFYVLKLWQADLCVPFGYNGDGLLQQAWTKTVYDYGWDTYNPALGAPWEAALVDFPHADGLHLLVIKLLGYVLRNAAQATNVFFILTFPLTTLTTLYVLRRFGISPVLAIAGSLLFTFHPFHLLRSVGHLFLASYFIIPLSVMIILWVFLGQLSLFPMTHSPPAEEASRRRKMLGSILICILQSSAGVYFAFFACFMLTVAGIAAAVRAKLYYPLVTAAALIAITTAGVFVNLAPNIRYVWQHGKNYAVGNRGWAEAELYGLKMANLLMPVRGHRIGALARLQQKYAVNGVLPTEGQLASLGAFCSVGFLYLCGRLLLKRRTAGEPSLLDALSVLNMSSLLLATIGGGGVLFNMLVTAKIRCYNRISIYIAFLSLLAACILLQRLIAWHERRGRPHWQLTLLMIAITTVGILDQLPARYSAHAFNFPAVVKRWNHDAQFFRMVEQSVPDLSMIAQYPYMPYPESPPIHQMHDYEHLRGYMHSNRLRWSYGIIRGRSSDVWMKQVLALEPREQLRTLAATGFNGIYIDRRGYEDHGKSFEDVLRQELLVTPIESQDQTMAFYPIAEYFHKLQAETAPGELARLRERVLEPVAVLENGIDGDGWFRGTSGRVCIENPSGKARDASVAFKLSPGLPKPITIRVSGLDFEREVAVGPGGREVTERLALRPGRNYLHFHCDAEPLHAPGRDVRFRIEDLRCQTDAQLIGSSQSQKLR